MLIRHGHYHDKALKDVDAFLTAQASSFVSRPGFHLFGFRVPGFGFRSDFSGVRGSGFGFPRLGCRRYGHYHAQEMKDVDAFLTAQARPPPL